MDHKKNTEAGKCPHCGYPVAGSPQARCPRCNRPVLAPSCCRGSCRTCNKSC